MSGVAASVRRPLPASLHWLPAAFGVLALVALVAAYPLGSTVLAAMLAGYALLLTRVPSAAWVVLPGCLPVLDLAPLTGRFYFDEFDILLLATWTMAMCRCATRVPAPRCSPCLRCRCCWPPARRRGRRTGPI